MDITKRDTACNGCSNCFIFDPLLSGPTYQTGVTRNSTMAFLSLHLPVRKTSQTAEYSVFIKRRTLSDFCSILLHSTHMTVCIVRHGVTYLMQSQPWQNTNFLGENPCNVSLLSTGGRKAACYQSAVVCSQA